MDECIAAPENWVMYVLIRQELPSDGFLDSQKCDAVLRNKRDKLWKMFGLQDSWRYPGDPTCFGEGDEARAFFEAALHGGDGRGNGMGCDTNWIRGSPGELGGWGARPLHGPAIMGQDVDIYAYCSQLSGHRTPPTVYDDTRKHEDLKLVEMCLSAKRNFIRVLDGPIWTLCTNIEWQTCLVQGLLPGQTGQTARGNDVHFATAPKEVPMKWLRDPPSMCRRGCEWGFSSSDIFFWEVCFLNHVCENRDELFQVGMGEPFSCEFSREKYGELVDVLR